MLKKLFGAVVFGFALICSQISFADNWGCGEGLRSMVESLNLDEAKKAEVKTILEQLKNNMKGIASQMDSIDKQINEQVVSDKMDQDAVNGLVDQKAKLIGDMIKAKLTAKNQIIALLTPEQKKALMDKMTKLEDKISARFKKCHQQDQD
jgi:Spy/CpxP family protein refolding chaperone